MISDQLKQLVQDIFSQLNNTEAHQRVKEDPEAHLLSLLAQIKRELMGDAKFRRTLYNTVEPSSYENHINEAKKLSEPDSSP